MAKMTTAQRIARQAAEQGRQEGLQEGRQEARQEGYQEGLALGLIKVLSFRFKGTVPEPALVRIRGASIAELDRWTERVLEAETLDDVLR